MKIKGDTWTEYVPDWEINIILLRREFVRLLTQNSETKDMRSRDFNDAIFDDKEGLARYSNIDMEMVMEKFDSALNNLLRMEKSKEALSNTLGGKK